MYHREQKRRDLEVSNAALRGRLARMLVDQVLNPPTSKHGVIVIRATNALIDIQSQQGHGEEMRRLIDKVVTEIPRGRAAVHALGMTGIKTSP